MNSISSRVKSTSNRTNSISNSISNRVSTIANRVNSSTQAVRGYHWVRLNIMLYCCLEPHPPEHMYCHMLVYCCCYWQDYKELESAVNHRQRPVESTSARSTPVHRRHAALGPAKSTESFEKSNFSHKITSRSNTVETYVNSLCCVCTCTCICVLYLTW